MTGAEYGGGPPFAIGIGGGSGSGKSTLAAFLAGRLGRVALLHQDNYNRDHGRLSGFDPQAFNFDALEAWDVQALAADLAALKAGRAVAQPLYDFHRHCRRTDSLVVPPAPFILVEGIQVLHPPELTRLYDLTVYLDVPDDIRLARRLLRDVVERGRAAAGVVAQYLTTVRPMHHRYSQPARFTADVLLAVDGAAAALSPAALPAQLARMAAMIEDHVRRRREAGPG